jgi:hypothetical protein
MEKTMLRLSRLAAGIGLGMILTACGGAADPNDPADPADPGAPNAEVGNEPVNVAKEAATGCLTFQTGVNGTVFTTYVQQLSPNKNYGTVGTMTAGNSTNAGIQQALLWVDLSSIPNPASAVILSSTLTIEEDAPTTNSNLTGTVDIYRINNPSTSNCAVPSSCPASGWTPTTVTYSTFASAYDNSTVWGSFASTTATKAVTVDLTSLTQDWINGTYTNNGIVLYEAGTLHETFIPNSNNPDVEFRPSLVVCYAADAGHTGTALMSGGASSLSPNYQGTLSLGESPGGNFLTSPNYTYHGGLVGATQSK